MDDTMCVVHACVFKFEIILCAYVSKPLKTTTTQYTYIIMYYTNHIYTRNMVFLETDCLLELRNCTLAQSLLESIVNIKFTASIKYSFRLYT